MRVIIAASVLLAGCATSTVPRSATLAQKYVADIGVVKTCVADVQRQCGNLYAPLTPVIMTALTAASPATAAGIVLAAVSAAPAVYSDVQAILCALRVVEADIKAAKPTAALLTPESIAVAIADSLQSAQSMAVLEQPDACTYAGDPAEPCAQLSTRNVPEWPEQ